MKKEELKQLFILTNLFENNEYLDKYCDLIINNTNTTKNQNKKYTEKHHIVPKCLSKYCTINCKMKEINLLYSDHIKAHFYLANCCKMENTALFIDIVASIRYFDFIGTKYINFEKKKKINKKDILNVDLFLTTNFARIQELKQNQQLLIQKQAYETAIELYNNGNTILGKDKDNNKINYFLYLGYCRKYGFVNQGTEILRLKQKHFGNLVSGLLIENKNGIDIYKELQMNPKTCKSRYYYTCKRLNLINYYTLQHHHRQKLTKTKPRKKLTKQELSKILSKAHIGLKQSKSHIFNAKISRLKFGPKTKSKRKIIGLFITKNLRKISGNKLTIKFNKKFNTNLKSGNIKNTYYSICEKDQLNKLCVSNRSIKFRSSILGSHREIYTTIYNLRVIKQYTGKQITNGYLVNKNVKTTECNCKFMFNYSKKRLSSI